jgi:hypothetical protein
MRRSGMKSRNFNKEAQEEEEKTEEVTKISQ